MKYVKLFLLLLTILTSVAISSYGQDGPPPDNGRDEQSDDRRPNLLAELGLSREQVQQIRRMNQARRPLMMEAQRRVRESNRALDMAIYRDSVSDEEFQSRLREVQAAQSELARLRFEGELSVRRILTPEQLTRFRELRQRFAQERQEQIRNRRQQRRGRGVPPISDAAPRRSRVND